GYEPMHRIAVGGMSEVFRAQMPQAAGDDRAVVIKRLLNRLLDDPEYREMFEEESRLGLLIDSPNVVEVLDRGEDDGVPFIVLEYVFGVDLWQLGRWLVRNRRRLAVPLAVYVATEILAGVEAVHAVRDTDGNPLLAVHRDVSPSNVFLSVHGDVKLGDLGIARPLVRQNQRPIGRRSMRAKGKLGYLAPEQVAGATVDQRADVFAAAVVAVELLMGQPLFTGGTELAILLAIRDCDLSRFDRAALGLPRGLVSALRQALDSDPEERTGSAKALREQLLPFAIGSRDGYIDDLGAFVTEVIDSGEAATGAYDRTSLAATVEESDPSIDPILAELITPAMGPERGKRPVTPDPLAVGPSYVIEAAGESHGPMPYAEVVRGIVQGRFGPTTVVVKDDDTALPLSARRELARHLPPSTRTPTHQESTGLAATSESFSLSPSFGMLHVLTRSFLEQETGLYLCEHGDVRKEVYVADGQPVYVTSNQASELLGEYLVTAGVIDRDELDLVLAVLPRFEGRLGDTLIGLGLVEPLLLVRHIANKVRDQLLSVFAWDAGTVSFYRNAAGPESSFNLGLESWSILEDGAAVRVERGLSKQILDAARARGVEKVPGRTDLPMMPSRFSAVIFALSQPRTLEALERHAGEASRAHRLLVVLAALGAVRVRTLPGK
ncbi:MAG: serine/threonine protein kinase, partial [Deltaproteobacteria bacterium]|nr:serine/threonine protein kinase [Deltaproteobacteria bacterium]